MMEVRSLLDSDALIRLRLPYGSFRADTLIGLFALADSLIVLFALPTSVSECCKEMYKH
jgi:hypothetical protein